MWEAIILKFSGRRFGHEHRPYMNEISIFIKGFTDVSVGKESASKAGDTEGLGSLPGSGRSPGGGNSSLLQYCCLKNLVVRGAWQAQVQRVGHDWALEDAAGTQRENALPFHPQREVTGKRTADGEPACRLLQDWTGALILAARNKVLLFIEHRLTQTNHRMLIPYSGQNGLKHFSLSVYQEYKKRDENVSIN